MSETLYLAHHGIKGMRWGVRRFQEEDGSLTPAGRRRYGAEVMNSLRKKAKKSRAERNERINYRRREIMKKTYDDKETAQKKAIRQDARANRAQDALIGASINVGYASAKALMSGRPISLMDLAIGAGSGAVEGMLIGGAGRLAIKKLAGE